MKDKNTPWNKRIYALYKGEAFLSEGTIREISKETNKTIEFLRWMNTPAYKKRCGNSKKRLNLIEIEE